MQKRMAERMALRMAGLKAQLKITPAQESAWNTYVAAMQPPARPQDPPMKHDAADASTAPQRADQMQQRMAERQARMKQRSDAIKAFYGQLTPEQQKIYDEQHSPMRLSRNRSGNAQTGN
jgi:hypothetical protein